jgi:hypothetical protein
VLRWFVKDKLLRIAVAILALIIAVVIFDIVSDLPTRYPLFGVFSYALVPLLFIAGAVVFVIAILKS